MSRWAVAWRVGFCGLAAGVVINAQEPAPACQVRGSQEWLASRPSPLDSATLTIGDRIVKICYSRPSARGRAVFDSLVPFGKAWRTGANEPTTITLTGRLDVAGVVLPPGRYVILTVPRADQWMVLFHSTTETDPAKMFRSLVDVGTGTARVERADTPIEQFTIRAVADSTQPAFLLEWGSLRARVPVRAVRSSAYP